MTGNEITAELLNAYVDGELSRSEAAGVARAAARSPALAARIATLREMKAAVSDMAPERELSLPRAPEGRGRGMWFAAAAAALLVCLLGGLIYAFPPAAPSERAVANALQSHHGAWTFEQAGDTPATMPAGLARDGWPPDLASARLSFAGVERITLSGLDMLRLGYEGTRGCKLSLYVLRSGDLPQAEDFPEALHMRSWTIGERSFLLMADGMPRGRFEDIAMAMEKSLRDGRPFDAPTRQRLARARAASPPCSA